MIIKDLHTNIKKFIQNAHQGIYVDFYPEIRKSLKIPAVLIEMTELRHDDDAGTEQLAMIAFFEARCIVAPENDGGMVARELAASVSYALYRAGRMDLPVMPAVINSVSQDFMKPELDAYEVWAVEWQHGIFIGDNLWDINVLPREITLGPIPNRKVQPMEPGVLIPHELYSDIEMLVREHKPELYERLWIETN